MTALTSSPVESLAGTAIVPGDKSISHRALMIGALAAGETIIHGLLNGDDVMRTAAALEKMGVRSHCDADGVWHVHGVGVGGLGEPTDILDLGTSGTGARLLMGLVATHAITAHFTGDASLRNRPMARIADPIEQMGARVIARDGGRMPLCVIGARQPVPIEYILPVPSAQVKSAVLLAGLNTPGETIVVESRPSRDHTELMLRHFGATLTVEELPDGGKRITLTGEPELEPRDVTVPRDPSSAAFPTVAALIAKQAEIRIPVVGLNPLRAGLFKTLTEMGADITFENRRDEAGEPVADLIVRAGGLKAIDVPPERAPSMIDEYPILAIAAAAADGITRMRGLEELRVKESDRLTAICDGLSRIGVKAVIEGDDLIVHGTNGAIPGGGRVEARMDHRIAMSFLVAGTGAMKSVTIDDAAHIGTSFPGFTGLMNRLGAKIAEANAD
jgi:3-phosphoshikimate 1-carboxyvinyltransferase